MKGFIMTTAELFTDSPILAVDADANMLITADGVFEEIDGTWERVYWPVPVDEWPDVLQGASDMLSELVAEKADDDPVLQVILETRYQIR